MLSNCFQKRDYWKGHKFPDAYENVEKRVWERWDNYPTPNGVIIEKVPGRRGMYRKSGSNLEFGPIEEKKIDLLLDQWKELNVNQEKIDTGHMTIFTIFFAAFGIASAFKGEGISPILFWMLPPAISVLFWFEAYRLKEAELLCRYLGGIEREINKHMLSALYVDKPDERGKGLFQWYSYQHARYDYTYNIANKFMWVPILLAIILIYVYFFAEGPTTGKYYEFYRPMLGISIILNGVATACILAYWPIVRTLQKRERER